MADTENLINLRTLRWREFAAKIAGRCAAIAKFPCHYGFDSGNEILANRVNRHEFACLALGFM